MDESNLVLYFSQTDRGINLSPRSDIHQICLPKASNENKEKWKDRNVETVGYATDDLTHTRGDRMKVANMIVHTQSACNTKLENKLIVNNKCMYIVTRKYPLRRYILGSRVPGTPRVMG